MLLKVLEVVVGLVMGGCDECIGGHRRGGTAERAAWGAAHNADPPVVVGTVDDGLSMVWARQNRAEPPK